MKSLMIGALGALIVVLLALGIIDQVSIHKRLERAEGNIQAIANVLRASQPMPTEKK